jgi:predicted metal-dependent phosphoesterase TrpH
MIDLHSHTNESDGTFTPAELIAEAQRIGLEALAITDHDTLAGYDLALPLARVARLDLLCGIELSTRFHGNSVHLLGYFPQADPGPEFRAWLTSLLSSRRERNGSLIVRLRSLGIDITLEEVEREGRSLTGRPHFARVLVAKGHARDLQHAFDEYLGESARTYVQRQEVPIPEAIERIRNAGGIAAMAHPARVAKNHWETLNLWVGELAALGMQAIEVHHSDHSPEGIAFYSSLAHRYNLAMTGGSDFHGGNKPHIHLGTGKNGNVKVPRELLENLRQLARRPLSS